MNMRKIGDNSLCKALIVYELIYVVVILTILYKCCNARHMHPFNPIGYPCRSIEMEMERETDHVENCGEEVIDCSPYIHNRYRSIDGRCNNPFFPRWGSTGSQFDRMAEKNKVYEPTLDMEFKRLRNNHTLPNARETSNAIHSFDGALEKEDAREFSLFLMQFSQFVDHDLTLTPQTPSCLSGCTATEAGDNVCCDQFIAFHANPENFPNYTRSSECWPIPVKEGDPYFDEDGPKCLEFKRSVKVECDVALRNVDSEDLSEFNEITHFIDLSVIYGSDEEKETELRALSKGHLRLNQFQDEKLPFELNRCAGEDLVPPISHPLQFNAGDVRANENPGLQSIHTVWVKEHNRLADEIYNKFPEKTDEEIFQEARKYLIAVWQHIVYTEWLPLVIGEKNMLDLGLQNTKRSDYDPTQRPTIFQEFSTAAFRFGHGLIRSLIQMHELPPDAATLSKSTLVKPTKNEEINLHDHFFRTDLIQDKRIHEIMTGMTVQGSNSFGPKIANAVRLQLFRMENRAFGNDLPALNIQRGRDHFIASYDDARKACGLTLLPDSWNDDLRPPELPKAEWDKFKTVYISPKDIELFPAGMSESPSPGGIVGPTFACIIGKQFQRLKYGDRYFYAHKASTDPTAPTHPLSQSDLELISKRTLYGIMCDNMKDVMPMVVKNPFFKLSEKNPMVRCDSISEMRGGAMNLFDGAPSTSVPPAKVEKGPEVLLVAGGFDGDKILDNVELYSPDGTCNFHISQLPQYLYGLFCFTSKDEIYCCGGDQPPSTTCYRYFIDKDTDPIGHWEPDDTKTLNRGRFLSTVVKVQNSGVVIVSGGRGEGSDKTMEFLNRYSGRWHMGPDNQVESPNKVPRVRSCMVIGNDLKMIDFGGLDQPNTLGTFDEITGIWTFNNNTINHNDRHSCAMIPHTEEDPEVLIVGNRQQPTIYNVKAHIERETVGKLSVDRGFGSMVDLNGIIYMVGGDNHPGMVERFDPEHETFSSVPSDLTIGRSRFGYTSVPARIFEHLGCTQTVKNSRDGGYSAWTPYSGCSAICEGQQGIRIRRRFCNNPIPSRNGKTCLQQNLGNSREQIECVGTVPYQSENRKRDCYIDNS